MFRIGSDGHKRALDTTHDLVTQSILHGAWHPPWALLAHAVADHLLILFEEARREAQGVIEQRLMTPIGSEQFERLGRKRRRFDASQPRDDTAIDKRLYIFVAHHPHRT